MPLIAENGLELYEDTVTWGVDEAIPKILSREVDNILEAG